MTCKRCECNEHGHRLIAVVHNCERQISAITAPCSCMTASDYTKSGKSKLGKTGSDSPAFVNEKYRHNAEVQKRRREFKVIVNETEPLPSDKSAPDLTFVVDEPQDS
jgi:hypothetical protein